MIKIIQTNSHAFSVYYTFNVISYDLPRGIQGKCLSKGPDMTEKMSFRTLASFQPLIERAI